MKEHGNCNWYRLLQPHANFCRAMTVFTPPLKKARLGSEARERAFTVVAPRLCNSVPRELRLAFNLSSFQRFLKTTFKKWAFALA